MKKLMIAALGLSLVSGLVVLADDAKPAEKKTDKKAGKKAKPADSKKDEKKS